MPSKPKPSTPPGRNSFGRTYQEQSDYEKSKMKPPKETNPLADFIGGLLKPKGKTPASKPMAPAMKEKAKKAALAKKIASKKSVIPASPTH